LITIIDKDERTVLRIASNANLNLTVLQLIRLIQKELKMAKPIALVIPHPLPVLDHLRDLVSPVLDDELTLKECDLPNDNTLQIRDAAAVGQSSNEVPAAEEQAKKEAAAAAAAAAEEQAKKEAVAATAAAAEAEEQTKKEAAAAAADKQAKKEADKQASKKAAAAADREERLGERRGCKTRGT
jgi:hypothetical protein